MVHEIWESTCSKACDILRFCELLKYITHCKSDHEFCQDPCSLVTMDASDNRNGWGLLSLGMQGFDRLVSSNRRSCRGTISSCVKPKTSIRQTYFDPTAREPGSWKDSSILHFLPEKYTRESESPPVYVEPFMRSPSWKLETWKWDSEIIPPRKTYREGVTICHHLIKSLVFYLKKKTVPISINHFG